MEATPAHSARRKDKHRAGKPQDQSEEPLLDGEVELSPAGTPPGGGGFLSSCCGVFAALLPSSGPAQPSQGKAKIEPKTYFANERTYLQWFNAGAVMGSVALALLAMPGNGWYAGVVFLPLAVLLMLYALYTYQHRLRMIQARKMEGYHDAWGPVVLTLALAVAYIATGAFSLLKRTA
jgi:uncharacterized membrane protein YidH (DUF202 family)